MDEQTQPAGSSPVERPVRPLVHSALLAEGCQRLREWAAIGPVQRAAVETFAEQLLVAERERCARIVEDMVRAVDGADALAAIRVA